MWVVSLGREDPLEKETATHSRILAWRIPWAEEPGGLQSVGSQGSDRTERTCSVGILCLCSWVRLTASFTSPGCLR